MVIVDAIADERSHTKEHQTPGHRANRRTQPTERLPEGNALRGYGAGRDLIGTSSTVGVEHAFKASARCGAGLLDGKQGELFPDGDFVAALGADAEVPFHF